MFAHTGQFGHRIVAICCDGGSSHVYNRCYNNHLKQTLYVALIHHANMRVFCAKCCAYKQNKHKLGAICTKGIFVRYDKNSAAYLVYFTESGKVLKYRVVKFTARNTSKQQTQTEYLSDDDDFRPFHHYDSPCSSSDFHRSVG